MWSVLIHIHSVLELQLCCFLNNLTGKAVPLNFISLAGRPYSFRETFYTILKIASTQSAMKMENYLYKDVRVFL